MFTTIGFAPYLPPQGGCAGAASGERLRIFSECKVYKLVEMDQLDLTLNEPPIYKAVLGFREEDEMKASI